MPPPSRQMAVALSGKHLQLVELAEDWLQAKNTKASDRQLAKGHSDRARRGDLCRVGRLLCFVLGREHEPWGTEGHLDLDLGRCTLADFTTDNLTRALDAARTHFKPATVHRTLSTLRGFTRWMNARGHLKTDPCDQDELQLAAREPTKPRSLLSDDVDALRAIAATPPPKARGLWWPARDLALIEVLARCGLRADEVVSARYDWVDRRPRVPVFNVVGKGNRARNVPIPHQAVEALDTYLADRVDRLGRVSGAASLFVRTDGRPLQYGVLDRIVRGLAQRANVDLPEGAATHSLRHYFGTSLAFAGVHPMALAQLLGHRDVKTSMIYTELASAQLIDVLDTAGLL